MADEVIIITPELSPASGGVGDYTLRLLENWLKASDPKILVAQTVTGSPPYRIDRLGAEQVAIDAQLPQDGGKILVQYSAYGFDGHGFPRKLIRALIDWKRATGGRLVVMFHEIWTFWPVTNKNFFVQWLHRRALKRLLENTDEAFTSTRSQAEYLRKLWPHPRVHVLPVGSNIRRVEPVGLLRNRGCAVIFGQQATRIRALKIMHDTLVSLAKAGVLTKIISVGAGEDPTGGEEERALLAGLHLTEGFEQRGRRPESEISRLLLVAAFGIFAQDELSMTKSGTFMAYAAHELNVLADFAGKSESEPGCWLVSPQELLRGVSESELRTRAAALLAWQQRVSSWELISENFIKALDLKSPGVSRVGAASV